MCKPRATQKPRLSWYSFGGIWRPFQPSHLKNQKFHFISQNSPPSHLSMSWNTAKLALCKTHTTQNFRAPRLPWYSFGDICRPFQPSHLQNHQFQFFTKHPIKSSSQAVPDRQTWPCAKPTQLKPFVHQYFYGIHLGTFGGHSNTRISKTMSFIFSQNSHQAIYLSRATPPNLAMCKTHTTQNFCAPRISWYSFGGIWRLF